jgi:hypothetical protein
MDFSGTQLSLPNPVVGALYFKLLDEPERVRKLTLPEMRANATAAAAPALAGPASITTAPAHSPVKSET